MEGPPLGPGGEDITWPDQVAPRGRKASSTRKIKPQTSNLPCPLLGKRLFQRFHLGLLTGNGLLGQAGILGSRRFLRGCLHLTPDPGSRCFLCGCSPDPGHNGRHVRGMEGHASAPLCSLLLGDADGARRFFSDFNTVCLLCLSCCLLLV